MFTCIQRAKLILRQNFNSSRTQSWTLVIRWLSTCFGTFNIHLMTDPQWLIGLKVSSWMKTSSSRLTGHCVVEGDRCSLSWRFRSVSSSLCFWSKPWKHTTKGTVHLYMCLRSHEFRSDMDEINEINCPIYSHPACLVYRKLIAWTGLFDLSFIETEVIEELHVGANVRSWFNPASYVSSDTLNVKQSKRSFWTLLLETEVPVFIYAYGG